MIRGLVHTGELPNIPPGGTTTSSLVASIPNPGTNHTLLYVAYSRDMDRWVVVLGSGSLRRFLISSSGDLTTTSWLTIFDYTASSLRPQSVCMSGGFVYFVDNSTLKKLDTTNGAITDVATHGNLANSNVIADIAFGHYYFGSQIISLTTGVVSIATGSSSNATSHYSTQHDAMYVAFAKSVNKFTSTNPVVPVNVYTLYNLDGTTYTAGVTEPTPSVVDNGDTLIFHLNLKLSNGVLSILTGESDYTIYGNIGVNFTNVMPSGVASDKVQFLADGRVLPLAKSSAASMNYPARYNTDMALDSPGYSWSGGASVTEIWADTRPNKTIPLPTNLLQFRRVSDSIYTFRLTTNAVRRISYNSGASWSLMQTGLSEDLYIAPSGTMYCVHGSNGLVKTLDPLTDAGTIVNKGVLRGAWFYTHQASDVLVVIDPSGIHLFRESSGELIASYLSSASFSYTYSVIGNSILFSLGGVVVEIDLSIATPSVSTYIDPTQAAIGTCPSSATPRFVHIGGVCFFDTTTGNIVSAPNLLSLLSSLPRLSGSTDTVTVSYQVSPTGNAIRLAIYEPVTQRYYFSLTTDGISWSPLILLANSSYISLSGAVTSTQWVWATTTAIGSCNLSSGSVGGSHTISGTPWFTETASFGYNKSTATVVMYDLVSGESSTWSLPSSVTGYGKYGAVETATDYMYSPSMFANGLSDAIIVPKPASTLYTGTGYYFFGDTFCVPGFAYNGVSGMWERRLSMSESPYAYVLLPNLQTALRHVWQPMATVEAYELPPYFGYSNPSRASSAQSLVGRYASSINAILVSQTIFKICWFSLTTKQFVVADADPELLHFVSGSSKSGVFIPQAGDIILYAGRLCRLDGYNIKSVTWTTTGALAISKSSNGAQYATTSGVFYSDGRVAGDLPRGVSSTAPIPMVDGFYRFSPISHLPTGKYLGNALPLTTSKYLVSFGTTRAASIVMDVYTGQRQYVSAFSIIYAENFAAFLSDYVLTAITPSVNTIHRRNPAAAAHTASYSGLTAIIKCSSGDAAVLVSTGRYTVVYNNDPFSRPFASVTTAYATSCFFHDTATDVISGYEVVKSSTTITVNYSPNILTTAFTTAAQFTVASTSFVPQVSGTHSGNAMIVDSSGSATDYYVVSPTGFGMYSISGNSLPVSIPRRSLVNGCMTAGIFSSNTYDLYEVNHVI